MSGLSPEISPKPKKTDFISIITVNLDCRGTLVWSSCCGDSGFERPLGKNLGTQPHLVLLKVNPEGMIIMKRSERSRKGKGVVSAAPSSSTK